MSSCELFLRTFTLYGSITCRLFFPTLNAFLSPSIAITLFQASTFSCLEHCCTLPADFLFPGLSPSWSFLHSACFLKYGPDYVNSCLKSFHGSLVPAEYWIQCFSLSAFLVLYPSIPPPQLIYS